MGIEHNCSTDNKKSWGCDQSSASVPYKVPCSCGGQKDCETCGGSEVYRLDRCPHYYIKNEMLFYKMWRAWTDKNLPPYKGAYLDQPRLLMQRFDLMDNLIAVAKAKRAKDDN